MDDREEQESGRDRDESRNQWMVRVEGGRAGMYRYGVACSME